MFDGFSDPDDRHSKMWLSNIFKKKQPAEQPPDNRIMLIAQLNARVQPMDRGEYFEDPLNDALQSSGLGEVTGGGTQLADEPDGIEFCDVEIMVNEASDATVNTVIETLERLGAPKGSLLKFPSGAADFPFGKLEGMALFLNGTDLPAEVYASSDVNEIISRCNELLEGIGGFRGHWEGSRETALYFYGDSFDAMSSAVADFIASEPGCALTRVVKIA